MRPGDLPDFEKPPVVEVALGVQFEPLQRLGSLHLAMLWEHWRDEFPQWDEQAPIPTIKEWFGAPAPARLDLQFNLGLPPLRRALYTNKDGTELRQVQADRFARNWRKTVDPYPHYDDREETGARGLRRRFQDDLEFFARFANDRGLGELRPTQCEITYVNHVPTASENGAAHLEDLLEPWSGRFSDSFLDEPEGTELALRFLIQDKGRKVGRLHIVSVPAQEQASGDRLTRLTLTARGMPLTDGIEGVMHFLDLGRRHIVKGFTSLTTPAMHKKWRRLDGR